MAQQPENIGSIAEQRAVVRALRQEVAAELVGVGRKTLQRRRAELPCTYYNQRTVLFDGPELVAFFMREAKGEGEGEEDISAWAEDDKAAYIKARTRKANADAEKAEHELRVQRGELLRREAVHRLLAELAAALRGTGETLYARFGEDARALLDLVLQQVARQMELRGQGDRGPGTGEGKEEEEEGTANEREWARMRKKRPVKRRRKK